MFFSFPIIKAPTEMTWLRGLFVCVLKFSSPTLTVRAL